VAIAKFGFAIEENFGQRAVDVAEAEKAEVVGANCMPRGDSSLISAARAAFHCNCADRSVKPLRQPGATLKGGATENAIASAAKPRRVSPSPWCVRA
jgi:hypothetical protein